LVKGCRHHSFSDGIPVDRTEAAPYYRTVTTKTESTLLGFSRYQWLVLTAAWLGWGFDVFDALLFNYVSRLCVPSLLGVPATDQQTITLWTGALTSVLLIGWALGGILFGKITDRFGRTKTLLYTMTTYALATACCAFAPNIWVLMFFRFVASLGIGGEWAAGAALVSETVPEKKRVQAGALLYTAAPAGLFFATFVTDLFTRRIDSIASDPDLSWRIVFLSGLLPAAAALLIRMKVQEPELWSPQKEAPKIAELFSPALRKTTWGALMVSSIALIMWWSCNAFIPAIAGFLVSDLQPPPAAAEVSAVRAAFITTGTVWFNFGGLLGTLLTVPIALRFGRRPMFFLYFLGSALAILCTFRLEIPPETRLRMMFLVGLTVFGVFGSFTFYLPELFPTRLRGTGCGFCYNTGRFITAAGPFLVGSLAKSAQSSADIRAIVSWVAVVPVIGIILLLSGLADETRGRSFG